MKKILITWLSLNLYFLASAQQPDNIVVSGNFINTPFKDFAEEIEMKTPLRFYYQQDRIKDVQISFSGTDVSLAQVLNDPLKEAGLQLFIEGNSIYIYPGERITTELPSYKISWIEHTDTGSLESITETERRYIEGKMISSIEVLEIGDKQKTAGISTCIINGRIVDESN
jgi:hypothetical protein